MQDGGGLPSESQWWKYLYSTIVLFFCLIICVIGGGMFARTSAVILLVVVVCTLSVFISVFVENNTIQISIPTSNGFVYNNATDNTTKYGNYTGLRKETFKQNLYGQSSGSNCCQDAVIVCKQSLIILYCCKF